ncbi:MAG: heme-binding protein [Betaproteobacteria bacterium]|nr:heme-binding protein [Betaproteobacteria bacterium]
MNLVRTEATLTAEGAGFLIQKSIETAKESGLKISVCVLDSGGRLKSFSSMDEAPAVSLEACIKKAKTAIGFGIPTGEQWHQFIKNDPILQQGVQQLPDFILLGGGSPVFFQGRLVGAIGVSGGHYKQDEACTKAALDAFEQAIRG